MSSCQVQFSVLSHAAWAPGLTTHSDWQEWARAPFVIEGSAEPAVSAMPSMLRRRAGFLGKLALEVAYQCVAGQEKTEGVWAESTPTVFCSRHGDVERSLALLNNLADREPMSPTNFGLAVHNAIAGLFSIARGDRASHIAIAAGQSTVEHGVIEACSLLNQGAAQVLLVVYDSSLPDVYSAYRDCVEQPHAWAWLMGPGSEQSLALSWSETTAIEPDRAAMPPGLAVWKFYVNVEQQYLHQDGRRQWLWSRHG